MQFPSNEILDHYEWAAEFGMAAIETGSPKTSALAEKVLFELSTSDERS